MPFFIYYKNTNKMNVILKNKSRLDNSKGYLITSKEYKCQIVRSLKYNFVIIKIGNKEFKTDRFNLK